MNRIKKWRQLVFYSVIITLIVMVNLFIIRLAFVHGPSMKPTLEDMSMVFVLQLLYSPKNGDVVVFDSKTPFNVSAVKRVIAVGGQRVRIEKNWVYINDQLLSEPYLNSGAWNNEDFSVTVPDGYVFVMGDNRGESKDSRDFGCIPVSRIIGKVLFK